MAQLQAVSNTITRPTPTAESGNTPVSLRGTKYNELAMEPYHLDQYAIALEGSYFVFTNPTPGTGVAATTSLTNFTSGGTKPFLFIGNNNVAGGPNLELDYLKLIQTAGQLPTSATNIQIAISLDTVAAKGATGTAVTPVNINPLSTIVTNAVVLNTATTNADSSNAKLLYHAYMEPIVTATPCAVAGDLFFVKFGGIERNAGTNGAVQLAAGTPLNVKYVTDQGPPIVIAPGWAACIKIFGAANAAAQTYEWECGYRER